MEIFEWADFILINMARCIHFLYIWNEQYLVQPVTGLFSYIILILMHLCYSQGKIRI